MFHALYGFQYTLQFINMKSLKRELCSSELAMIFGLIILVIFVLVDSVFGAIMRNSRFQVNSMIAERRMVGCFYPQYLNKKKKE